MSGSQEPIATVEELQAATEFFLGKLDGASLHEKEEAWMSWIHKRANKLLRDAAAFGKWEVVLDAPYQPTTPDECAALKRFGRKVKPLFPGCTMWVNEEEPEKEGEQATYTITLSWARAKAVAVSKSYETEQTGGPPALPEPHYDASTICKSDEAEAPQ